MNIFIGHLLQLFNYVKNKLTVETINFLLFKKNEMALGGNEKHTIMKYEMILNTLSANE